MGIDLTDAVRRAEAVLAGPAKCVSGEEYQGLCDDSVVDLARAVLQLAGRADAASIREAIAAVNEEALFADGFDAALVGYVAHWTVTPKGGATRTAAALYDRDKCIEQLADGMSIEEAEEFFEFNVAGAYVGEATPAFATLLR